MSFKPYQLAYLEVATSTRQRVVEIISYPIPGPKGETVMVRMVPGEPTTMEEVPITKLAPAPQMRWVHVAVVNSVLNFPEDMLRYDGAALFDHTLNESDPNQGEVLIYRVSETKAARWHDARWHSFQCTINNVLVRDLKNQI
jgi:hypothetical protein